MSSSEFKTISSILAILHRHTGADFSRFRPATVQRRILNRMISLGTESLEAYLCRLEGSQEEARQLLSRISIKVSRFYRNAASYDLLRSTVLPELALHAGPRGVRIWSAGCGLGEEAYTLAMLLEEAGFEGRVVATDLDPGAIEHATLGLYPRDALDELPADLARRYLTTADERQGRLQVDATVRARVRFEVLDLLKGRVPDEGGFDLVCCRNVLIYYQPDVHREMIGLFRSALRPGGFLFLGEAEWPPEPHAGFLECIARSARVFRMLPALQS